MIAHQSARNGPESFLRGRELRQDVHAVAILFHHALDTAELAFDSAQPPKIRRFDLRIYSNGFASSDGDFALTQSVVHAYHFSSCHASPLLEFPSAEPEAVGDHTERTEGHCRTGKHRA